MEVLIRVFYIISSYECTGEAAVNALLTAVNYAYKCFDYTIKCANEAALERWMDNNCNNIENNNGNNTQVQSPPFILPFHLPGLLNSWVGPLESIIDTHVVNAISVGLAEGLIGAQCANTLCVSSDVFTKGFLSHVYFDLLERSLFKMGLTTWATVVIQLHRVLSIALIDKAKIHTHTHTHIHTHMMIRHTHTHTHTHMIMINDV
eukprot:GHVR01016133.1.p1 GENE.GHVR01016133.1~~GHVR01016133.1.p1  ORF type:complete len:205 (+),score=94.32 GHVR01016133.1:266-880(+)